MPASEGLNVMPVIAYYIQKAIKPTGHCPEGCDAFLTLCDLVDALQMVPLKLTSAQYVEALTSSFLRLCELAGWEDVTIPKFHWLVHFGQHLQRHGHLPTCWVHERKHRLVKRYAQDVVNRRTYSKSVLSEVLSHQLHAVHESNSFDIEPGLTDPHKPVPRIMRFLDEHLNFAFSAGRVFTSVGARIGQLSRCHVKDVVIFTDSTRTQLHAGQLWLLVQVESVDFAIVSKWTVASTEPLMGAVSWRKRDDLCIVFLDDLLSSVIWTELEPNALVRVLVPSRFKNLIAAAA